jgi:hypothetical protein
MINRITPPNITSLNENEVILVGTNKDGRHGKGLANFAMNNFGLPYGAAHGHHGQTYAIVTKKNFWQERSSTLEEIKYEVDLFIEYAKLNSNLIFKVTLLGTNLAGYSIQEIAPLFYEAIPVKNIHLPVEFWDVLNK